MLNCIAVSWVQSRWTGLVRLVRVTVGFGWIGFRLDWVRLFWLGKPQIIKICSLKFFLNLLS